jgi:hypothetical protein
MPDVNDTLITADMQAHVARGLQPRNNMEFLLALTPPNPSKDFAPGISARPISVLPGFAEWDFSLGVCAVGGDPLERPTGQWGLRLNGHCVPPAQWFDERGATPTFIQQSIDGPAAVFLFPSAEFEMERVQGLELALGCMSEGMTTPSGKTVWLGPYWCRGPWVTPADRPEVALGRAMTPITHWNPDRRYTLAELERRLAPLAGIVSAGNAAIAAGKGRLQ